MNKDTPIDQIISFLRKNDYVYVRDRFGVVNVWVREEFNNFDELKEDHPGMEVYYAGPQLAVDNTPPPRPYRRRLLRNLREEIENKPAVKSNTSVLINRALRK